MRKTFILLLLVFVVLLSNCKKKAEEQEPLNPDLKIVEISEGGDRSYRMSMAMLKDGNFTVLKFERSLSNNYTCGLVDISFTNGVLKEGATKDIFVSKSVPIGNILTGKDGGFYGAIAPKGESSNKGLHFIKGENATTLVNHHEAATSEIPNVKKIIEADDGYFVLSNFGLKLMLTKLDNSFNTLWSKLYGNSGSSTIAEDICVLSDGSVGIIATHTGGSIGFYDYQYIKISNNGDSITSNEFGSLRQDGAVAIHSKGKKVYLIADERRTTNETESILTCCTENGEKLWERNFGENIKIRKIKSTDNELVAVGYITRAMQKDIYIVGVDFFGAKLWDKFYGEEGWNEEAADFYVRDGFINALISKYSLDFTSDSRIQFIRDKLGN